MNVGAPPIGYIDTRKVGPLESSWITSVATDRSGHAHVVDREWTVSIGVPHYGSLSVIGRVALWHVHLGPKLNDPKVDIDAQRMADTARHAHVTAMWSNRSWFGDSLISWCDPAGHIWQAPASKLTKEAPLAVAQARVAGSSLINSLVVARF